MHDDLRRVHRLKVCCRVDVSDRLGVWTATTDDLCARGCGLVSARAPRVGAILSLAISSDLFPDVLEVTGEVAWASDGRVGVSFLAGERRAGAMTPAAWLDRIVEHGRVLGPEPLDAEVPRVVPVVVRRSPSQALAQKRAGNEPARLDAEPSVLPFPAGQR